MKSKTEVFAAVILAGVFLLCGGASATAQSADASSNSHAGHEHAAPAKLVQQVRAATQQFVDVNVATAAGYGPFLGCISGSDHGAMGIHYVNGALLNGEIDASHPQALDLRTVEGQATAGGG